MHSFRKYKRKCQENLPFMVVISVRTQPGTKILLTAADIFVKKYRIHIREEKDF